MPHQGQYSVTIFNPSRTMGGTNNLLTRLAEVISTIEFVNLSIIDYKNGLSIKHLNEKGIFPRLIPLKDEEKIYVEDDILICILLHAKLIGRYFIPAKNTRILFWSTHPYDGMKLLPTFNFFLRYNKTLRKTIAVLISPVYKIKIKRFLKTCNKNNGLVWMDHHNFEVNKQFYDLEFTAKIWPVVTEYGKSKFAQRNDGSPINICVLGRLCDFKIIPVLSLIDQFSKFRSPYILNFIGDGPLRKVVEERLRTLEIKHFKFLGDIPIEHLDKVLLQNDVVIGMGLSILEAAKLSIPSLLINGAYRTRKAETKVRWLFECDPYYVGRILSTDEEEIGYSIDFIDNSKLTLNLSNIGDKCYSHWKKYHSLDSLRTLFIENISSNENKFDTISETLQLDFTSQVVQKIKNKIQKTNS